MMTKDELEKEAEEWVNKNKPVQDDWEDSDIIQAIIDTSEPRENRITELELKIKHLTEHLEPQAMTALFKQVEEEVKQEQRSKELETQIERMKCCYNCKQSQDECYCKIKRSDINDLSYWDCGCDKWEMKEDEF
jgi:hypothetical protein